MFDLTIIIPTIRPIHRLGVLLNSIPRIKGVNIELIIVNDNKTRLLKKSDFSNYKGDLIILNNISGKGACSARNYGLSLARGTYCHFMDDDDEYLDIQIQLTALIESDIICFNALICTDNLIHSTRHFYKGKSMIYGNTLGGLPRFLFKRSFLLNNNLKFPIKLSKYQDLAFLGQAQNFKPNIYFSSDLLMKANYSFNHDGISSSSSFNITSYYRSLLSFSNKSIINTNKKSVIKGFLKFQGWYLIISRPSFRIFIKLLLTDIFEKQFSLAVKHLLIYMFPRSILKIRSIR